MSEGFYRAFEDEHRGSRDMIKARQRIYLPFIQPLMEIYPAASAIDLGCGRGEWLELLIETGFQAQGVDLDDGMLAVCREHGLKVQTKDAIAGLKECADESQAVVSGFHLVEHIPFDVLQTLVSEAHRVLKPGGLLILETPNPENIVVGTANFYLDPTHKQPIPPLLLSFLAEHMGFPQVKIIRLQAPVDLKAGRKLTVHDVLGGVSPDYAIVAQKAAQDEILRQISLAFKPEYGVTLGQLAGAYDQQIDIRIANANAHADQSARLAEQSIARSEQAIARSEQAMAKANLAENALHAIYASTSWRITSPIRWFGDQIKLIRERGVKARLRDLVKKICKSLLTIAIKFFEARPDLRARYTGVSGKAKLYDHLRSMYLRISADDSNVESPLSTDSAYAPVLTTTEPTSIALKIHRDLKIAIENMKAK